MADIEQGKTETEYSIENVDDAVIVFTANCNFRDFSKHHFYVK